MLGILTQPLFGSFFKSNDSSKNTKDNSAYKLLKNNSTKLLNLKILIGNLEFYLPTNPNHLNPTTPNHLDEIKSLRGLISDIKRNLLPCYEIIKNSEYSNFNLHESITACDMILGLLQQWDKHEILTTNESKTLNKSLVIFSRNMHNVLGEIKF